MSLKKFALAAAQGATRGTAADMDGGNGAPISESARFERFQPTGRIGVRRSDGGVKLRPPPSHVNFEIGRGDVFCQMKAV